MNYSKSQQEAIRHKDGPMLVLAGPGSGKTAVITQRTIHLIEQHHVNPSNILVITFTRAAAQEMKQRFLAATGTDKTQVTFGTFHAIFFMVLKYAYHFESSNIVTDEQRYQFMREILSYHHLEYQDENEFISDLFADISRVKNERIPLDHFYSSHCGEDVFRKIYQAYTRRLSQNRLIDFDDMLTYTYELFSQRKDILSAWQRRYPYILVDEFQDINQIQYDIVRMMAQPADNLFVVGDDDQSIYRFRGSKPEIMLSFDKVYPAAKIVTLEQNYRCTPAIVAAMRVIVYDMMTHAEDYYNLLKSKYGYQGTVEGLKEKLYDYWIELVYNKVKNDVNNLYNAFQNQANNYLEDKGIPKYYPESMTSDTDFQSVRKTLFEIQENRKNLESKNLLLATSTISHGVDEDSFNIMYFFGIPNNNAEYIQAYSRTGRKYTGIVMDLIRLTRVRDRSYLKNFVIFHQNKDDLVEPVPINRWAKNAVYCTLPGLLVATLYQYYAPTMNIENVYFTSTWKKVFENEDIDPKEVAQILIGAYGCNDGEKMSDAYREAIIEEVLKICDGLKTHTPGPNEFLSDGISRYSHGNKKPMRSLRDTEEQVTIRID